jgi:hypothetical protein
MQESNRITRPDCLKKLGEEMLCNHHFLNGFLSNKDQQEKISKIIFVIGAGISYEAGGFPLGRPLALHLAEKIIGNSVKRKELFNKNISELQEKYGFDPQDFKTMLFALNKIDSENLVNHLIKNLDIQKDSYNSRSFDILANLLSKKYIDAIVDFNFDELLQISLNKKTNLPKVELVVSDKEHASILKHYIEDSTRFDVPIHLKIHGTISQKETLRFTRKDFYRIEPGMMDIFTKLISKQPVKLVVIGLRMKALDFTAHISESLHPDSEIYVIDKEEDVIGDKLEHLYKGFIKITDNRTLLSVFEELENMLE